MRKLRLALLIAVYIFMFAVLLMDLLVWRPG
jgi:hypothetical protein